MLKITDSAAKQIEIAAKQSDAGGMSLRLAVIKKDDQSIDYKMGFDQPLKHDIEVKNDTASVIYSPNFKALLECVVMDYVEIKDGEFRFIFMNPNDPSYVPPEIDHAPES